jgi:hypothetical protein
MNFKNLFFIFSVFFLVITNSYTFTLFKRSFQVEDTFPIATKLGGVVEDSFILRGKGRDVALNKAFSIHDAVISYLDSVPQSLNSIFSGKNTDEIVMGIYEFSDLKFSKNDKNIITKKLSDILLSFKRTTFREKLKRVGFYSAVIAAGFFSVGASAQWILKPDNTDFKVAIISTLLLNIVFAANNRSKGLISSFFSSIPRSLGVLGAGAGLGLYKRFILN